MVLGTIDNIESIDDIRIKQIEFACTTMYGSNADSYIQKYLEQEEEQSIDYVEQDIIQPVEPQPTVSTGPMDSPWPMKCHDTHHTGRSPYSTADNPLIEKWRFYADDWVEGGSVIDNDEVVYFGDFDRYFYAVYPNGTLKWKKLLSGWIWSAPAINEDGTIYVGTYGDHLYALNSDDGSQKWKFDADGSISSSPAIASDGTIYFGIMIGMDKGDIVAVNPDGTEKWRYETGFYITSDPAIADDGTIYIGSGDNYFYAMNPNGTLKWRYKTGDWVNSHPSISADGTIYFSSFDGNLYALNSDGTLKWTFGNSGSYVVSTVIADDGTLYLGGNKLYAINPEDGTLIWSYNPGDDWRVAHSSPAISSDGSIYVGICKGENEGGEVLALKPDGTEHWRSGIIVDYAVQSSPSIGADGTIYIGSSRGYCGYLHAYGSVDSNNPPETPTITGETNGKIGQEYEYRITCNDPDINPVSIYIDWGDGSNSGWNVYQASGQKSYYRHTWWKLGKSNIQVKAKDNQGAESDWTTLEVTMPRNKDLIDLMLERFPRLRFLFFGF